MVSKNCSVCLLGLKLLFKFQWQVERGKIRPMQGDVEFSNFWNSASSNNLCGFLGLTGVLELRVRSDKNTLEWVLANWKHFGGQAHVLLRSLVL